MFPLLKNRDNNSMFLYGCWEDQIKKPIKTKTYLVGQHYFNFFKEKKKTNPNPQRPVQLKSLENGS